MSSSMITQKLSQWNYTIYFTDYSRDSAVGKLVPFAFAALFSFLLVFLVALSVT